MLNQFPVSHIVIDNFLGTTDNQTVLEQINMLVPRMSQSTIFDHGLERVESSVKHNENLWLEAIDDSALQLYSYFNKYFFDSKILSLIENLPELSHINSSTTLFHNTLLSKYKADDFYDWHIDVGGHVTWSYVCCDNFVEGGEFVLSDAGYKQNRKNEVKIPCRNDTLIIFPAKYQHKVEAIQKGCRYSVQIFFS